MAKNKTSKKKGGQVVRLTPERWMCEKARTLPLGTTYMNYIPEEGTASVLVSRIRPSGNVAFAMFLVDTFCLGVKECYYQTNLTADEFRERSADLIESLGMKEVPYAEAHNLIYGAVEWAGEADIDPAREWGVAKYILEEDTDDVPYIEYEFGDEGKYHLIVANRMEEARMIPILQKRLGDKFVYTKPSQAVRDERRDYWSDDKRLPEEPFGYPDRPEYPAVCEVKNEWLRDALLSPENFFGLPQATIDRILALPPDEAAADIAQILLWASGQSLPLIEEEGQNAVIDHSAVLLGLMLLANIDSRAALPSVIDVVRQSNDYREVHLGDFFEELISQALYRAAGPDLAVLERLLSVPGMTNYSRYAVALALGMSAVHNPERRDDVMAILRRELQRLVTDLPALHAADGVYAGLLMSELADLKAVELLPEIHAVYETGQVNRSICGDYDDVREDMQYDDEIDPRSLTLQSLDDFAKSLAACRQITESETV